MTDADRQTERTAVLALLLAGLLFVGLAAVLAGPLLVAGATWVAGRPSPRDVVAPSTVTYVDELLTSRERDRAVSGVAPKYQPTDSRLAGQQLQRARDVTSHIGLIRIDPYASADAQMRQLSQIPELAGLPSEQLSALIEMPQAAFDQLAREVPIVVAQTLRQTIRPEALDLARSALIGNVDRAMDPATAALVASVAANFVVPNTAVDISATEAARQAASAAVAPVVRTIAAGETILRAGDIVEEDDLGAIEALGLSGPQAGWRDLLGLVLMVAALVVVSTGVLHRLVPNLWRRPRKLALLVVIVLLFAAGGRAVVPMGMVQAYAYPAAAAAMISALVIGLEAGVLSALVLALVVGLLAANGIEAATMVLLASLAGSLVVSRVERLAALPLAAAGAAATGFAVVLAFHLPGALTDWQELVQLGGAALGHAVLATALAALGVLAVGTLFGITTPIQLLELARPDNALLRELQSKAPGTYQHSIVLANLAESAASAIGADALLVRVGAYFHDIGKSGHPYFYIENQMGDVNPHDTLDPTTSARIVISHVADGAVMARKARLPEAVIDFIWQHHGTTRAEYFYHQASSQGNGEDVDESDFRYPGPRPQTREAAIVMLADGSEATVRAAGTDALGHIDELVGSFFQRRLASGQLDDSNLTLRDIRDIQAAFVSALQSMYHPRVRYPSDVSTGTA